MRELLEKEYKKHNNYYAVSEDNVDPILIAREFQDESIALICALFAYGNVSLIVKFLRTLDFSLLEKDPQTVQKTLQNYYYRFQKSEDIIALFVVLRKLKDIDSLENLFFIGYKKSNSILDGLDSLIGSIKAHSTINTKGYNFLVGNPPVTSRSHSPLKRWNMFLRWMVRKDNIDLGLWKNIDKKDLLIPLDTHTFKVSTKLNLLKRKSYDLKSVIQLTQTLKSYDPNDPIKYDFALYRLGQQNISL